MIWVAYFLLAVTVLVGAFGALMGLWGRGSGE